MVVYTTDEGEFEAVAEKIATDRDESVVTDLDAALQSNESIVYVEAPSEIREEVLLALQERLVECGPDRGAFGIITGYTSELAEELYFTRAENTGEDALLPRNPPEGMPDPPETTVLADQAVTADNVEDLSANRLRSFQIASGGRPIHVFLSDGLICGIPETDRFDDFSGPEPFCVEDGEFDCPLDGKLVHAESIDASHFFLMSCSSTIDNGTAGLPTNVGLGLLDGADSLVGTYRVGFNQPPELLLHHSLLSAGYDVSERCYLLNRSSHANGLMLYPYVSFGRPDSQVADPHESQFEVQIDGGERKADATVGTADRHIQQDERRVRLTDRHVRQDDRYIRLTDVDAYVADFRISEEDLPPADDRLYVRNLTATDDRVYYSIFEKDGDTRVLVFTGGRMQMDELDLVVSPHRARHVERRTAIESAKNVRQTAEMGFLNSDAAERASQLDTQLRSLPVTTEDEKFDANLHREFQQDFSILHGQVNAIREEILTTLRDRSDFVHYEYGTNAADDDVYRYPHSCRICGDRPVFIKQITGWSGEAKRLIGSCPRCSFIFDVPASEKTAEPTYPKVNCELDADGPRRQPVEIEFTNSTDDPMQATFQPLVLHRDNEATDFFEPRERDAVLLSGETHTAEFTLDTTLLPHNMYFVMGVVVGNLDVYAGYDVPVKGDKREYYPRHLR